MGRLDREPRPSREELETTLKFVAETDNLDGEAYTLAAEVRALREERDARSADATSNSKGWSGALAKVHQLKAENAKLREAAEAYRRDERNYAQLDTLLDQSPKVTRIEPREPGPPGGIVKVSRKELAAMYPDATFRTAGTDALVKASDVAALVKAAQDVLRSDLTGWTERQLRAALAKLGAEAPPEDESAMGEQCRRLDALVKAAGDARQYMTGKPDDGLDWVAVTRALEAALKPFDTER